MAIVRETQIESKDGIKKTIDKNSMGMALDILQRGLYAFPIKSTVRELASNAHDAIKERDVAKAILLGKEKIENHYDLSLGVNGVYHASGWDPDYFDLDWLDDDPQVRIYYEEGTLRDTLRIVDNGVGLGKDRLLGYFQLNYSSKRANKDTLGRFGLGSKVPLSLGVESFRVINRYNGMKFRFDVYLDKIESVIPKFSDGKMNENVQLTQDVYEDGELVKAGYSAFWEPTTEKNGVEVQVQVKKHNKNAFFEGIESQLMYMPGILFLAKEKDGISHTPIDIKAKIEYRDDNVVISKTTVYNKPHILLGTGDVLINYGFLAFNELEIEPKGGAVGLIMDINEIEVTPSREAPVWSSKTREAILKKYSKVTETATKYVSEEIGNETDYLNWMRKATTILSSIRAQSSTQGDTTVLSTLASIIDFAEIKNLKFNPDPSIVLKNDVKEMFGKEFSLRLVRWDRWGDKVERDVVKDLSSLNFPIYITEIGANKYKDRYLYEEFGQFLLIYAKEKHKEFKRADLIMNSTISKDYESITIPEDRLALYMSEKTDEGDDDDADLATVSSKSASELRKENKEIVVHIANSDYNGNWTFSAEDRKISDMFGVQTGTNVMYGTGNDRNTMKSILKILPTYFTKKTSSKFYKDEDHTKLSAMLVAKDNLKYIASSSRFQSIKEILVDSYDEKTGHLNLSDRMKYVVTAIIIEASIHVTKSDNGFNSYRVLTDGRNGEKLTVLMGDTKEKKEACNFTFDSVTFISNLRNQLTDDPLYVFFSKVGRLNLIESKVIDASEEDKEELLKEINDTLPDFLCNDIGEINSVDALYPSLYKEAVSIMAAIKKGWDIISLYYGKYYYSDEDLNRVSSQVKIYLNALEE